MKVNLSMTVAGVIAAVLATGTIVIAQDAQQQSNWNGPRIDKLTARLDDEATRFNATVETVPTDDTLEQGRLVAMGGAESGGAGMACFTCHGANGAGDGSGAFPRLAGLPGWYMYKQLMDYASGARPNQVMSGIARKLTEQEMEAVSAYYALVNAPYPEAPTIPLTTDYQWGAQLGAVGSAEKGIPACINCHGAQGSGMPPSVPYLAGQYAEYIALQLKLWKEGVRDNDAMNVMSAIAAKMSEEDMKAVGRYYQRVRPLEEEGQAGLTTSGGTQTTSSN